MLQSLVRRNSHALDRLLDALSDPHRRERAIVVLLTAYAAIWTVYAVISRASQDIHFDMGEAVVWSREALLANPKHPPLSAWLPWSWFEVFPAADWAYYLLSMVLATLALWVAWKIAGRFLSPDKQVAGLALLTLVPFFNFLALKYNANAVLIPLWALATWAFLHSFETRRPLPAVLAGLAAAAAMLGKYWSVFLLAGLGLAALFDPRKRDYFRSPAPWITIVFGAVAVAPHAIWLFGQGTTFGYALAAHPGTYWTAFTSGIGFILGTLAYAAIPAIIAAIATRPSRAAFADTAWPREPERRFTAIAFWAPILLPAAAAVLAQTRIVPLWSIGAMTLLPVILLSSPMILLSRDMLRRILGIAIAVPVVSLLASPIIAFVIHQRGVENYSDQYSLLAQATERAWREATDKPLRIVGSYDSLLYGTSFYFRGRPRTFEIVTPRVTPWTSQTDVERDGIAMVCPIDVAFCLNALDARVARNPDARRSEVALSRRFLGLSGAPHRYAIAVIPPRP
jgi:4-amino-4-deoxy-L-arabinose transferase-like glycosyltransferase